MSPGATQTTVAQRDQDTDGDHPGMTSLLLVAGHVDEGAETGVAAIVDKVDEILTDGVQARGQRLVLDETLELNARGGLLPEDGVAGLDVEMDEEQGVDGRTVEGLVRRHADREGGLSSARGGHGD